MTSTRATGDDRTETSAGGTPVGPGRDGAGPRRRWASRCPGPLLLAAALALAGRSVAADDPPAPAGPPPTDAPRPASEAGERAALEKALGWFFANADAMPLEFAVGNAEKIRRVTTDEALRRKLDELALRRLGELPKEPPTVDPEDVARRRWQAFGPAVQDLLYRKALGLPWKDGANALGRLWAERGEALLPTSITLSPRLVAARQAVRLGLPAGGAYAKTLEAVRAQEKSGLRSGRRTHLFPYYACTHVVFTASDYYTRYLDAAAFASEVACFDRALDEAAAAAELDEDTADLLSEVLVSRKLLRLPPDARTEAFRRRLLALQTADGSWGERDVMTSRAHHTTVAILALMEFSPELRVGLDLL